MDCLYLVRNGVPFDIAFMLPPPERLAWVVVMGRFDGLDYDWQGRKWVSG